MENSNNNQNQDQEKTEDLKKDYKIETMSDNIVEESLDQQIDAKLEKKPLYDNISNIPNEITPEQIENNENNNEEGLSENIIKEQDNTIDSEQNKFRRSVSFIIGFGGILIIGLIVIAVIYIFSGNGNKIAPTQEEIPVTEESNNSVENTEIIFQQPLFPIDQNLTFNIDDNMTRIDFLSQLREVINQSFDLSEQGDVINLYLTNKNEKLSLNNLASLLNIELDSYFNTDNYTLFYYDSLNGARFGLAIEVINNALTKDYLNEIENIILSLNNQIFSEYTGGILSKSKSQGFNNSIYQGVDIRFINFDNFISIDYGFKNNIFIIAGSMETMHEIIDRINLMENAK